ncbi:MAG: hypothetical protein JKY04_03220, partial [Sneathiella sp.]|nr:hypothetical protein [Sneathiella sp.]
MQALSQENDLYVSVLLLSDDLRLSEGVRASITNPTFRICTALLTDINILDGFAARTDVIVALVDRQNFSLHMDLLSSGAPNECAPKIIIVDTCPSPERAVLCMKAGAVDYVARGAESIGDCAQQLEQIFLDEMRVNSKSKVTSNTTSESKLLEEMRLNIRNTVQAAKALSKCRTLSDVCETLL